MKIDQLLQRDIQEEEDPGAPAWMATFADMSTLLLTFFVLLLSFANMDAQKFREMLGSVKDAFGVQKETVGYFQAKSTEVFDISAGADAKEADEGKSREEILSMEQALSVLQALFEGVGEGVEVVMEEEVGVTVRVDGKLLFPSGEAEFRPGAEAVLDRVANLLQKYTFDLYILGHTDSVPIQTPRFPSNWELSSARAAAALRYMVKHRIDPQRLVAVGFADSRPIASNDTYEGRSRNRRVEFLFKSPDTLPAGGFKAARP